jgi:hypothetical protein
MILLTLSLLSSVIPVSPGESIQEALDTAVSGDTVLLLPGIHSGSGGHLISMTGVHDGVTLLGSVSDPALVTLDGSGLDSCIAYLDGLNQGEIGPGTLLAGITFTGAVLTDASLGGAIHSLYASPSLLRCVFEGNSADGGGGVYVWRGAPSFVSCEFIDNQCVTAGAGLYIYTSSPGCQIISGSFSGNHSQDDGGGVFLFHSSPLIRNVLFVDNYSWDNGGGIYCYGLSDPDIGFCTFSGNEVSYQGSAVYFRQGSSPTVHDNVVSGNIGAAFWVDGGGSPVFWNNCVWGNSGGNYGNLPDPTGSAGNISADPLFTSGYHLSNQEAGQAVTSPCVDTGSGEPLEFGLEIYWTRTDSIPDSSTADMGFHYGPLPDQMSSGGEGILLGAAELRLFPNPSTGLLNLGPLMPDCISRIAVFGTDGRLLADAVVSDAESVLLELPDLTPGVYFVSVATDAEVRSGLFVLVSR